MNCLLVEEQENGVLLITLNNPKKKNAIDSQLYKDLTIALQNAETSDSVRAVVLTGRGDYFSSGNDLGGFMTVDMSDSKQINLFVQEAKDTLYQFVRTLIHFSKVLIAAVNGPAIGIACTSLMHFDFVFAAQK
eukprot:TRINITY_DN15238_c0_g1_i4.p1 TRINITY_DN15238_c0_g1~~TRINITY_DN15238_c0_g1_i4.p1  ORF type:complete len:133 (-),score=31.13 TRINITY_DN15238_c0_g1_i4:53-451(-)